MDISSPPLSDDSVSLASPHVSGIPEGTLHSQECESCVFKRDQPNAVVKGDGGAIGLTECPAALQKWLFSRPEMARVIADFER